MRTARLSTVFSTEHQKHPTGGPARVLIRLSDGELTRLAHEYKGGGYKILLSGSSLLSILENGSTVAIARVEEFEPDNLTPSKIKLVWGKAISLKALPRIQDKRSPDKKGHPIKQIPRPHSLV